MSKRKARITEEPSDSVISLFRNHFAASSSLATALKVAGISTDTYSQWLDEASSGNPRPLVARFVEAAVSMEGELKLLHENELAKFFDKDWKALAWWLERKYPGEYGDARAKSKEPTETERDPFEKLLDFSPAALALRKNVLEEAD